MTLTTTQKSFIAAIKEKIRLAQYEALQEVNTQLIRLYWDIGKVIEPRFLLSKSVYEGIKL